MHAVAGCVDVWEGRLGVVGGVWEGGRGGVVIGGVVCGGVGWLS